MNLTIIKLNIATVMLFIIFFFPSIALSVEITEAQEISDFEMEYYYDETNAMDIHSITKEKKFSVINNMIKTKALYDTHWFKVKLHNTTTKPQTRVLAFTEHFFYLFDFYEVNENNTVLNISHNCFDAHMEDKNVKDQFPAYKISLQSQESKTLYVQVRSDTEIVALFTIYKPEIYTKTREHQNYFYLFYFGMLFAIAIYNLMIYAYNKERIYLYYLGYIVFNCVWALTQSGLIVYVMPIGFINYYFATLPMTLYMFILFTEELLKDDIKVPSFNRLITFFKVFLIVGFVVILVDQKIGIYFIYLITLLLFFLGYFIIKHGNKETRLYSFALTVYLLSVSVPVLYMSELIPYTFLSRNAIYLGSMVEIVLFSVLLAHRMQRLKYDKIITNQKLIKYQHQRNEWLEKKVDEQTKDLKLLFAELQHRVKNNFQFILTFIWLQKKSIKDEKAIEAFDIVTKRIYAISLLHELLYKKEEATINFKDYIEEFISTFQVATNDITIDTEIENIEFSFDTAVTFGLILNELITNSIKYASKSVDKLHISIGFYKKDGNYIFSFKDNGNGFDKEEFNSNSAGLGYELIHELTNKLENAKIEFDSQNGVSVIITCAIKDEDGK